MSPQSAAEMAREYIRRGMYPVPVPFRQKGPIIENWQQLRITPEEVNSYFRGWINVGVILGVPSNGTVDLDLDCVEALALCDKVLPITPSSFGRASKPRSHRLYRVAGPAPSIKLTDPIRKDTLVELRGDKRDGSAGMQTVFPLSTHPSGERIEWAEDGEPAFVEYQDLKRRTYILATQVLILRYGNGAASFERAMAQADPRIKAQVEHWRAEVDAAQPSRAHNGQLPAPATGLAHLDRPSRRVNDTAQIKHAPLQVTEHDLTELWTALSYLGSRGRDDWFKIGGALHDCTDWPEELRRAVWDCWSIELDVPPPGENKKFDRVDQDTTWRNFERPYAGTRITLGTIIYRAQEAGWDGHTHKPLPNVLRAFLPATGMFEQTSQQTKRKLRVVGADELLSTPAPPRRWMVESWIPAAETTMLGGDGGTGKSTLVLQLIAAAVSGQEWLGRKVEQCNVLYVSAEDPIKREIHFRLEQIAKHLKATKDQLARFKIIDLTGDDEDEGSSSDSIIAGFDKNGQLKTMPLFVEIERAAREHNAGCIIFDAVADFFGGNENERHEVRAFIRLLRGLAMRLDAAVVIVAHPSVDGIKTGRGYSGSTHWNNAVRSRLYFTHVQPDGADKPPNPDLRVLELQKSNRARSGEKIYMLWHEGRFVLSAREANRNLASEAKVEELFLTLLEATAKQGVNVSLSRRSGNFAPAAFAGMSAAQGTGKDALEAAMQRLIEQKRIRNEDYGPPSKGWHRLVAVPATPTPTPGNGASPFGVFQKSEN